MSTERSAKTILFLLAFVHLGCFGAYVIKRANPRPSVNVPDRSLKIGLAIEAAVKDVQEFDGIKVEDVRGTLWNGYLNGFGPNAISDRFGVTPGEYVVSLERVDFEKGRLVNIGYVAVRYRAVLKNPEGDIVRQSVRTVRPRNVGESDGVKLLADVVEVMYEQLAEDLFVEGNIVNPDKKNRDGRVHEM